MGVSKVKIGDNTLVDLTADTVTPEVLQKGYTAHGADGEPIEGNAKTVLMWQNTENGTYKFEQNGDRWVADNRGINSSVATSTWTVTVPEKTTAYIGYRVASETDYDKISITLNGHVLFGDFVSNGIMSAETTVTLNLFSGKNTLVATYVKYSSGDKNGDMAYVVLPPIGEKPGQYKYQGKSVTPSGNPQTVYPDTGYDGLYAVTVSAGASGVATGTVTLPAVSTTNVSINIGFKPTVLLLTNSDRFIIYDSKISTAKNYYGRLSNNIFSEQNVGATNGTIQSIGSTTVLKPGITAMTNQTLNWYAIG